MTAKRNQMTGDEFQDFLDEMELDQLDFAALTGAGNRTVRNWRLGDRSIPGTVVAFIRLLEGHPERLKEAWENAGLPDGRKVAPRGRPKKGRDNG